MRRLISRFSITNLLICLFAPTTGVVPACEWDRDTARAENISPYMHTPSSMNDMPEVYSIIVGRFERNPPLYYEIRLANVTREIEANPSAYDLYDDAGVALDRLQRPGEAIEWMDRKRRRLEVDGKFNDAPSRNPNLDRSSDPNYRYFANIGTFRIHQWIQNGRDREKLAEARQARKEIATAIKINPKAHFGREEYQLAAMDWIIDLHSKPEQNIQYISGSFPTFLAFAKSDSSKTDPQNRRQAVLGTGGIISLGNGWKSPDAHYALAKALMEHKKEKMAYFTILRIEELLKSGATSLVPGAPVGDRLFEAMSWPFSREAKAKKAEFEIARFAAVKWHKRRTDYMMARLTEGRHPDTDPAFWSEYVEPKPPGFWVRFYFRVKHLGAAGWALAGLSLILIMSILRRWVHRRNKAVFAQPEPTPEIKA